MIPTRGIFVSKRGNHVFPPMRIADRHRLNDTEGLSEQKQDMKTTFIRTDKKNKRHLKLVSLGEMVQALKGDDYYEEIIVMEKEITTL